MPGSTRPEAIATKWRSRIAASRRSAGLRFHSRAVAGISRDFEDALVRLAIGIDPSLDDLRVLEIDPGMIREARILERAQEEALALDPRRTVAGEEASW